MTLQLTYRPDTCTCGHPDGSHRRTRTSAPRSIPVGGCLVDGCECDGFEPDMETLLRREVLRLRALVREESNRAAA